MNDSIGRGVNSIELFTGTGGLALGLEMAGFHHQALYEWDKDSCNNVKHNIDNGFSTIKDWNIYNADVRDVDFSTWYGLDVVAGGPPCQPFSLGGKHKANNDKRDMFPEAIRAVREAKPSAFVFENVKGLLRESFRPYFDYVILQLKHPDVVKDVGMTWEEHSSLLKKIDEEGKNIGIGYNVVFQLFNVADYGIPQMRHRVVIVGFRNDLNKKWIPPLPTHSQEALIYSKWVTYKYWKSHNLPIPEKADVTQRQIQEAKKAVESKAVPLNRWRTVRDAIAGLPDPVHNSEIKTAPFYDHDFRDGAKTYPGHCGCSLDEPSKTIKAGSHGVPGGENMLITDDGSVRYYTVRESARIQSFPDDYRFSASWTESMRQIGNAVPVEFAKIIGNSVMSQLMEANDEKN